MASTQPQEQQAGEPQQQQRQNSTGQPQNPEPEALRNLIVNYIPSTIDENQVRQLFEHYGPIESVRIIRDRETKQSRGFGFVKYQYAMSAYNAIQYVNGYQVVNKRLKVAYANENDAAQAQQQMYNPMMMNMGAMGGMVNRPQVQQQQQPQQGMQQRQPRQYNNNGQQQQNYQQYNGQQQQAYPQQFNGQQQQQAQQQAYPQQQAVAPQ